MYSFWFPTTSLIIDDNVTFAASLMDILMENGLCAKCLQNNVLMNYIKRYKGFVDNFDTIFVEKERSGKTPLKLGNIFKIMHNPDRFKLISTIIVDFNMPGLNGQDLCEMLPSWLSANKIILTGEMWIEKAVKLLDQGVIDGFLRKGGRGLSDIVVDTVQKSARSFKYFPFVDDDLIEDPILKDFVEKFIRRVDYCEYYIFNKNGSYIFLDKNARFSGLLILSEEEMISMYEFLKIEFPDDSRIEAIRLFEGIPLLFADEIDLDYMLGHIRMCNVLDASSGRYYYAYTDDQSCFSVGSESVVGYNNFLSSPKHKVMESYW